MSRSKGNRIKREGIQWLEDRGWIADTVELTGKFRKFKDCYSGLCVNCWKRPDKDEECCDNKYRFDGFDVVALKDGRCIFVQYKANTPPTQKGFKEFAKRFASTQVEVWCMTKYDYKGWRIQKYQPDGTITELDLRK